MIDKQPSEISLSASSYYYIDYISKSDQRKKDFFNNFSYGVDNKVFAIRQYAIYLDDNLDRLVYLESVIEEVKKANNQVNSEYTSSDQSQNYVNNESSTKSWDEYKKKQQEQCQLDLNKYNICMNEYNAKMAEYNTCQTKNADSNTIVKSCCYKPSNLCHKPVCAF